MRWAALPYHSHSDSDTFLFALSHYTPPFCDANIVPRPAVVPLPELQSGVAGM